MSLQVQLLSEALCRLLFIAHVDDGGEVGEPAPQRSRQTWVGVLLLELPACRSQFPTQQSRTTIPAATSGRSATSSAGSTPGGLVGPTVYLRDTKILSPVLVSAIVAGGTGSPTAAAS